MTTEVGIYKRKQERKKARKQKLDQESDQEKKESFFFFSWSSSCFLDRFLGRVLVFFYKFPPLCDPNTQADMFSQIFDFPPAAAKTPGLCQSIFLEDQ